MTSSTKHFESTHNPSEVVKIENPWQQQTPVNKDSANIAINEEVDISQKYEAGESDICNSTRPSGHIDANKSLPAPGNTAPVSTENKAGEGEEEDEDEFEEFEDDSEPDSDFPEFEGGEPRGRVISPISASSTKPGVVRPTRPK